MTGRYLTDKIGDSSKQTHLAIVCSVGDEPQIVGVKHHKTSTAAATKPFEFSEEKWELVPDILQTQEFFDAAVKIRFERFIQETLDANVLETPKYDFNQDVYRRVEVMLCLDNLAEPDISQDAKNGLQNIIRK